MAACCDTAEISKYTLQSQGMVAPEAPFASFRHPEADPGTSAVFPTLVDLGARPLKLPLGAFNGQGQHQRAVSSV